ncbi:Lactate utilization protein C OS=Lysinibacillus sphaericus OX=1421 GN=lutC PE=3 SV=1 [Lysinibacillus sphaericus]
MDWQVVVAVRGCSVITWQDKRFKNYGLAQLMHTQWPQVDIELYVWDETQPEENIRQAEKANIGLTISEMTLAESGTAVLFSDKYRGRTISFLPEKSIILMPKSTIVPRITQAARRMSQKVQNGSISLLALTLLQWPK